jgi:hypothetical protein
VPFTYIAHQAPVIPLKQRWPDRWDGLALVVGTIMPDLWYVTSGWLFGPFGAPMWVDGHRWDLIVQNCVIPGTVLTVLLRRWTMPVVPAVMPRAGFLRLQDYRLVALARHRWWVTAYSVLAGAATHLVLDVLTTAPKPEAYVRQIVASVLLGVAALWLVREIARRKLLWQWHGYANRCPPDPVVRGNGVVVIRSVLAVGIALSLLYGVARLGDGKVPAFMAFSCVCIVTLLVAGLVGRRWVEPMPAADAASPFSVTAR